MAGYEQCNSIFLFAEECAQVIFSEIHQDDEVEQPVFRGLIRPEASSVYPQKVVSAVFMRNHRGEVCITISDAAFLGAEFLVIEEETSNVYAYYDDKITFLSDVSSGTIRAMKDARFAHLRAMRVDGTIGEIKIRVKEDMPVLA
jgi:hypothetical protein